MTGTVHHRGVIVGSTAALGYLARTVVPQGGTEEDVRLACAQELATGISNARVILFERSGHYPFLEGPDAFWPRSVVKENEWPPSCQNRPMPAATSASTTISDESQTTAFDVFIGILLNL